MISLPNKNRPAVKTKSLFLLQSLRWQAIVVACYFVGLISFCRCPVTPLSLRRADPVHPVDPRFSSVSPSGLLAVIFIGSADKTNELAGAAGPPWATV